MAERSRALPAWMKKKETEEEPRRSMKRKSSRAAFYCMNEEELTHAAALYLDLCHVTLLTDSQVEEEPGDAAVKMKRRRSDSSKTTAQPAMEKEEREEEGSSDCGDTQKDTSYVSESDLDLTEIIEIPQHQGSEGQRSEPDQDHSSRLQAEDRDEEEDDALQLVREIFFP